MVNCDKINNCKFYPGILFLSMLSISRKMEEGRERQRRESRSDFLVRAGVGVEVIYLVKVLSGTSSVRSLWL